MDAGPPELSPFDRLAEALTVGADPERAVPMAHYMKDRFAFFGIPSPDRRAIQRAVLGRWKPSQGDLVVFVDAAWARPEREFQYVACDLVAQSAKHASPDLLVALERWITQRSWWDTVDALADAVGTLVKASPELGETLDRWIEAEDFWLARVAIIHQLRFRTDTDEDRLFRYCTKRADDGVFFVRKAIGWALREYGKTAPDAVVAYVERHPELSALSQREALRRIKAR